MYFHTAYFKFTTMKILIIIFCNKIEEEKLWDNLIFGCLLIESIKSTGWKILKLLIWLNIKVPLKFCRHPKCDETPMPKSKWSAPIATPMIWHAEVWWFTCSCQSVMIWPAKAQWFYIDSLKIRKLFPFTLCNSSNNPNTIVCARYKQKWIKNKKGE